MRHWRGKSAGFSLIELVVALAVIAVLAAIALPSYQASMRKSRRTEGKVLLQTVLAAEERYYVNFNHYTADTGSAGIATAKESLPSGYYALTKLDLGAGAQSVIATVSPRNAQQDDACGDLTLDSTGHRDATGASAAECW
jgi:type IV pilus assembly protein PilE